MKAPIPIKLENYEGPLDLLLDLIEKNKMDIYDIPIFEITRQYLSYIKDLSNLDLEIASSFMLMAATLLDIKSRMLLPQVADETGEIIDPRMELVEALIEYKLYKYLALGLSGMENAAGRSLYKEQTLPSDVAAYIPPIDYEAILNGISLERLNKMYHEILRRSIDRVDTVRSKFGKIKKEEISLEEKMTYVIQKLNLLGRVSLFQMIETGSVEFIKVSVIVTFLVILELAKTGEAFIEQDEEFGEIWLVSASSVNEGLSQTMRYE